MDEGEHDSHDIHITSAAHHIGGHYVVASLILRHRAFEIRALDLRSHQTWVSSLSVFHVAAIFTKDSFTNGYKCFWDGLARCIDLHEVEGDDLADDNETPIMKEVVHVNTQHIRSFPIVKNSTHHDAYLLHQTKLTHNGLLWDVEFLSAVAEPFDIEVTVKSTEPLISYIYTTKAEYLRPVIDRCCFGRLADRRLTFEAPLAGQPSLFQVLMDEIIFDEAAGVVFLKCAEATKLEEFYHSTISTDKGKYIEETFDEDALVASMRQVVESSIDVDALSSSNAAVDITAITVSIRENRAAASSRVAEIQGKFTAHHSPTGRVPLQLMSRRDTTNEIPSFVYLQEVLGTRSPRTNICKANIVQVLTSETDLGNYMTDCYRGHLMELADGCSFRSIIKSSETLSMEGKDIIEIFVVMKGILPVRYDDRCEVVKEGSIIGLPLLRGIRKWDVTISLWKHDSLYLCCIPTHLVLRVLGISRPDTMLYMTSFWKYLRLWPRFTDPRSVDQQVRDNLKSISDSLVESKRHRDIQPQPMQEDVDAQSSGRVYGTVGRSNSTKSIQSVKTAESTVDEEASSNSNVESSNRSDGNEGSARDVAKSAAEPKTSTPKFIQSPESPTVSFPPRAMKADNDVDEDQLRIQNSRKVIETSRIRYFQSGEEIFSADMPRFYFFLIVKGECAFLRNIPHPQDHTIHPRANANQLDSTSAASSMRKTYDHHNVAEHREEIDIGQHLMAGDFCFMDGERGDWLSRQDEIIARMKQQLALNPNYEFKKAHMFGKHKHVLLSLTLTEVCMVPLTYIHDCGAIFIELLQLVQTKYPNLTKSNQQLMIQMEDNRLFKRDRPNLVARLLRETDGMVPTAQAIQFGYRTNAMYTSYEDMVRNERLSASVRKGTRTSTIPISGNTHVGHSRPSPNSDVQLKSNAAPQLRPSSGKSRKGPRRHQSNAVQETGLSNTMKLTPRAPP